VSGSHVHALTVHGHSPLHRLPARVKLVALGLFVVAVVATPRHQLWAFAVYALLVTMVLVVAELPAKFVLKRMGLEVPFVAFALFLPFVGGAPRITAWGLMLSIEGIWAAWNIIAKATLGTAASIVVIATTETPHILRGLGQLRLPPTMVAVAGFMVRYLEVVGDEVRRMRIAMAARGYQPTWLGQAKALAVAGGALFIRSYERGERVHQAMLARGFTGAMPDLIDDHADRSDWAVALSVPLSAWLVAALAVAA